MAVKHLFSMYALGTNVAQNKIFFWFVFSLPHCGAVAAGESGVSLPPAAEMQHVVLHESSRAALNHS